MAAKKLSLVVAAALALSACKQQPELYAPPVSQFICYDGSEVVEQHAGVERAVTTRHSPVWRIEYADSDIVAYYHQTEGETCYVELVE